MASLPEGRRDLAFAGVLAVAAGALYAATLQEHLWGDGEILVGLAREGRLHVLNKLFFAPLHAVASGVLAVAGRSEPRESLLFLSVACTAVAVGATYLAARAAGTGTGGSAFAAGLLALAPSVWFFATTVEVHPPQLAAAALAAWWAARAHCAGELGADALPLAAVLVGVAGTHLTGFLWAPALAALLVWSARRGRRPRRVLPALALAAGFLLFVVALKPALTGAPLQENVGVGQIVARAARRFPWSGGMLARDLGLGAALLLAAPVAWLALRRWRSRAEAELLLVALLLAAPFVALLPAFPVYERGAYYLSLFPLLALGAAGLHRAFPRSVTPALFLALVPQGMLAWREIREWQERYPFAEWVAAIERDTGGRALVLVHVAEARGVVGRWSDMTAVSLDEILRAGSAAELAAWAAPQDLWVVVLRPLQETELPRHRVFLDAYAGETGGPLEGSDPAYVLYPPPARPAGPGSG